MRRRKMRGVVQKVLDTLFFPLRALFLPLEGIFWLSSLREERMEIVAKYASGRVLDLGCGPGNIFVNHFADPGSVGIDVFAYEGVEIIHEDMTTLPFDDSTFDSVTLIAVGGHIPKHTRVGQFAEIARLLKPGSKFLMTEGEPITQMIGHLWRHFSFAIIGKKDMDSERGMKEDEQYCMPVSEIMVYLNTPPMRLIKHEKFMWGLNNLYVAEKCGKQVT